MMRNSREQAFEVIAKRVPRFMAEVLLRDLEIAGFAVLRVKGDGEPTLGLRIVHIDRGGINQVRATVDANMAGLPVRAMIVEPPSVVRDDDLTLYAAKHLLSTLVYATMDALIAPLAELYRSIEPLPPSEQHKEKGLES